MSIYYVFQLALGVSVLIFDIDTLTLFAGGWLVGSALAPLMWD